MMLGSLPVPKWEVDREACVKDCATKTAGEIVVAGEVEHETVVRGGRREDRRFLTRVTTA